MSKEGQKMSLETASDSALSKAACPVLGITDNFQ